MDVAGVVEKFGVPPAQIPDYLALVGDTSDNIPGLAGVGPKTAVKWLQQCGSIEGVIARASELSPERFRPLVVAESDRLRLNLKLTTLNLGLPTVADTPTRVQLESLCRLLEELEMRSALAEARQRYSQPELF